MSPIAYIGCLDNFLHCLRQMVSLKILMLHITHSLAKSIFDPANDDVVANVLRCVQSLIFRTCILTFGFREVLGPSAEPGSDYGWSRTLLLNTLSGEAMQQCSNLWSLPHIPEFKVTLYENDVAFGDDWWTTEITKNVPALKDNLAVHARMLCTSNTSFIEGWCTEHTLNGYSSPTIYKSMGQRIASERGHIHVSVLLQHKLCFHY